MRTACLLLAGLFATAALVGAETQVFGSAAQGMPLFGRLGSARLAALGGSFHSLVQGPDALLVNPAGIAHVRTVHAGAHHESWLGDVNQETLYAVTPVGSGVGFGAYAHVIDYGVFELRDSSGTRLGEMSARDYAVGLAAGVASLLGFSGGVGVRGVRENLIRQDIFALGVDTGVAWAGPDGWSGGLAAINVGPGFGGPQGAESLRWGIARRVDTVQGWFWPALAFSWEPRVTPRVHLGAELRAGKNFDIRLGYQHRFVQTLLDGVQGLSVGLGLTLANMGVDYAFLPQGDLGAGHRLSVRWSQPTPTATPTPTPPPFEAAPIAAAVAPQADLAYVADPLEPARQLEAAGRWGEALVEYERVSAEQPDLLGAWRGMADLAYRLKLKPKAVAAFKQILRLEPEPQLQDWLAAYEAEPDAPVALPSAP